MVTRWRCPNSIGNINYISRLGPPLDKSRNRTSVADPWSSYPPLRSSVPLIAVSSPSSSSRSMPLPSPCVALLACKTVRSYASNPRTYLLTSLQHPDTSTQPHGLTFQLYNTSSRALVVIPSEPVERPFASFYRREGEHPRRPLNVPLLRHLWQSCGVSCRGRPCRIFVKGHGSGMDLISIFSLRIFIVT